ncbi:unnamed protein product [Camellia sinensis]
MFGKDNVANQREHLILLLANVHIQRFQPDQQPRLDDTALIEQSLVKTSTTNLTIGASAFHQKKKLKRTGP